MIAALVATRGRPGNIEQLLECAAATDTSLVRWFIGLDKDDEHNYPRHDNVRYHVSKREQLTVKTNALAHLAWDEYPILAQFDDDQFPRTQHWDQAIVSAMDELGDGLVYCDDGWMGAQTPVCPFWPARFAKTLGWLLHPSMDHLFVDNTLLELARAAGCVRYLPDVLIEHMHPIVNKGEWDDSYAHSNSGEMWTHDQSAFHTYINGEQFKRDVATLQQLRSLRV